MVKVGIQGLGVVVRISFVSLLILQCWNIVLVLLEPLPLPCYRDTAFVASSLV
jgi:hypothetical protein